MLNEMRSADWMQSVAAEMNVPETAFVRRVEKDYALRWFTPTVEVELCGHATLASAHVVWREGLVRRGEPIRFHTKSGVLTCSQAGEIIELDFPALPVTQARPPSGLLEALGVQASFVGASKFDKFVVVESEAILYMLKPNFRALRGIPGMRGVIVSSPSSERRFDFVSRFFAPGAGIDEDPVTGSAHCCLAPFWSQRLGKSAMTAFQASRRGGIVHMRLVNDRVFLGGKAVTVMRGELSC